MKYTDHVFDWRERRKQVESTHHERQQQQQFEHPEARNRMIRRALGTLPRGFPAFVVVGGIGFLVDAGTLGVLVHGYDWGNYTARLVSFTVAVTTTWALHRTFAFADGKTIDKRREYTRYLVVQGGGMAINLPVYSACISNSETMSQWPVLAVAVGSAAAMIFNYIGARMLVFTGPAE